MVNSQYLKKCRQIDIEKVSMNNDIYKGPINESINHGWSRISRTESPSYKRIINIVSKRRRITLTNTPTYILLTLTRLGLTPITKSPLTPQELTEKLKYFSLLKVFQKIFFYT